MTLLNPLIATLLLTYSYINETAVKVPAGNTQPNEDDSAEYHQMGENIFTQIKKLQASDEWEDLIQEGVQRIELDGEVTFRGSVELDIPAKLLFDDMWFKPETTPEWHKSVESVTILRNISAHAKIQYQTVAEQLQGLIKARDFLVLVYYVKEGNTYYVVYKSIKYKGMPKQDGFVRAVNGPSAMIMESLPGDRRTKFTLVMNTNFKLGWVPLSMVQGLYPGFVMDYVDAVTKHAQDLVSNQ